MDITTFWQEWSSHYSSPWVSGIMLTGVVAAVVFCIGMLIRYLARPLVLYAARRRNFKRVLRIVQADWRFRIVAEHYDGPPHAANYNHYVEGVSKHRTSGYRKWVSFGCALAKIGPQSAAGAIQAAQREVAGYIANGMEYMLDGQAHRVQETWGPVDNDPAPKLCWGHLKYNRGYAQTGPNEFSLGSYTAVRGMAIEELVRCIDHPHNNDRWKVDYWKTVLADRFPKRALELAGKVLLPPTPASTEPVKPAPGGSTSDPGFRIVGESPNPGASVWTARSQGPIPLADMTSGHLRSAIMCLLRRDLRYIDQFRLLPDMLSVYVNRPGRTDGMRKASDRHLLAGDLVMREIGEQGSGKYEVMRVVKNSDTGDSVITESVVGTTHCGWDWTATNLTRIAGLC